MIAWMTIGRYAPSPSGQLHLGNLRTAVLAWLFARAAGGQFVLRVEDLDRERCREEYVAEQLRDLSAIGIDWDRPVLRQSSRDAAYRESLETLVAAGATFECYCTREQIRTAQSAPHGDPQRYPGTCRDLSDAQRAERRRTSRAPTVRLRSNTRRYRWPDLVLGEQSALADDVPLARFDGAIAYHLAVVVDDLYQGVDQVVRGDDLLAVTATQLRLIELLGGQPPRYGHVALVVGPTGARLAKRDGAISLQDLAERGIGVGEVVRWIARSLGAAVDIDAVSVDAMRNSFAPEQLPIVPVEFDL